jgi:hypothetical protein
MPTVLRVGGFRFFFYSSDRNEPPHIHVEKDNNTAKFWLTPIRLQDSHGFSRKELNKILSIIEENIELILGRWNEYFDN